MKIDQLLIYYLLKHREMNLQGIGTFRLEGTVNDPGEKGKPLVIPADAITFEYNPKTKEEESLINFISENTGKIHPLASADLDSYLMLGTQFINIGKPMILPNIGTLEKTNTGELIFKGGEYVMEHIVSNDVKKPAEAESESAPQEESFSDFPVQERNYGKAIPYLILLVILGLVVWAVWKYAFNHTPEETITQTETNANVDTSNKTLNNTKVDSNAIGSSPGSSQFVSVDTPGFKVVVKTYTSLARAQHMLDTLKTNHRNVSIYTPDDSQHYRIVESFKLPLSDTARIIRLINRYYGKGKYTIE